MSSPLQIVVPNPQKNFWKKILVRGERAKGVVAEGLGDGFLITGGWKATIRGESE